jgi:hypothetical protein
VKVAVGQWIGLKLKKLGGCIKKRDSVEKMFRKKMEDGGTSRMHQQTTTRLKREQGRGQVEGSWSLGQR